MSKLRGYFITGLIAIIPIGATIAILVLSLKVINSLLSMPVSSFFGIKQKFISSSIDLTSGILITIFVIIIAGYITTKIGKMGIFRWIKNLVAKVPVISSLYTSIKQMIDLFILNKSEFTRVVLIEYPRKGVYALGFVTTKPGKILDELTAKTLISLYVPKPLSIASGYLIFVPDDEIIPLDIPIDEGFKMVVSGGLVLPNTKYHEAK